MNLGLKHKNEVVIILRGGRYRAGWERVWGVSVVGASSRSRSLIYFLTWVVSTGVCFTSKLYFIPFLATLYGFVGS